MNAAVAETPAESQPRSWLVRPIAAWITPVHLLLSVILLLSLGMHFYNIQSIGYANSYYTAAVKSMLQSWHNFFFVAAEPGGSVSVDKPPLGLWIEAAFAGVLGVSGFSVVLPNILAGLASILLVYHLVQKYFGAGPGLISALVLALTPVSVVVDRNNTIDSLMILSLLLAAWAFINAAETGRLRSLLLGAFLVGLGFNIKMLQAFLPLPAFYALYFFGAKTSWRRKILNLGLASLLLGVVSLAWPVAVDLTPASQRPYVGSSSTNSELELIMGYNGLNRLLGGMGGRPARLSSDPGSGAALPGQPGGFNPGSAAFPPDGPGGFNPGAAFPPGGQNGAFNPPIFQGQAGRGFPVGGGGPGGFDIGQKGVLRFFTAPLAKEMSWLLPFALLAILLAAFSSRVRLPLISKEHKALVLWGGWLLTCLVFFSAAGFFHNYYLATLSPALAAMVGTGFAGLEKLYRRGLWQAGAALLAAAGLTLAFQLYLVSQFGLSGIWTGLAVSLLAAAGLIFLAGWLWKRVPSGWYPTGLYPSGWYPSGWYRVAAVPALIAILVIPAVWTGRSAAASTSAVLPEAYSGDLSNSSGFGRGFGGGPGSGAAGQALLDYLQAHTQNMKYLVAVQSSGQGSNLVLETGRPVLLMGGFSGSDPVVSASDLARLVADGQLRYILNGGGMAGGRSGNSEISSWIQANCKVVSGVSQPAGRDLGSLYQCGS